MNWLFRAALRLVPRAWRGAIEADLEEEAAAARRGRLWATWQMVRITAPLRARSAGWLVRADVRHAVRSLTRARWFTVGAVLTFALGIGANIAVFSVVDQALFRPLPFKDPASLIHIHRYRSSGADAKLGLDLAISTRWRRQSSTIEDLAYAQASAPRVTAGFPGGPVVLGGATHNLLRVLGVPPIAGRDFSIEDARARRRLLLLSYAAWQRFYGGVPDAIGRVVGTGATAYEIVGVLPERFVLPASTLVERLDGLTLLPETLDHLAPDGWLTTAPIARLKPGVTISQAAAELDALVASLASTMPLLERTVRDGARVEVLPAQTGIFLIYRPYLWLVTIGVLLILVVACVNLSTLLMARSRARERDAAVRAALGASKGRLIATAAFEASLVCAAGAGLGLLTLTALRPALIELVPAALRGSAVDVMAPRVILWTLVAAGVAAVLASVAPAWRVGRTDFVGILQKTRGSSGQARRRTGRALVALEAAFGIVLVSGAAVTVRNLAQMIFVDEGFRAADLYVGRAEHGSKIDAEAEKRTSPGLNPISQARWSAVRSALSALPGISTFGAMNNEMLGYKRSTDFWTQRGAEWGAVWGVSDGVFEALDTPLRAGRRIDAADVAAVAPVAMVNERGVSHLWPGVSPAGVLGREIQTAHGSRAIVGVLADVRPYPGFGPHPALFLPITDRAVPRTETALTVVVRMAPGRRLESAEFAAALNAGLPRAAASVVPAVDLLEPHLQRPRFQAQLFAVLAVIALLLSAVGLYAISSFEATRRRFETGVRVALGATARDIRRAVLGDALRPVVIGAAAGLGVSWWAAQFLQAFLIGVDARDPLTLFIVASVLVLTAAAAAWIPGRRAARTDPAAVLRNT